MKKNNGDQVNEVLNSLILSLEIISIDNDGFAKARILDPKFSQNIIKIPYNNQNIKFDENDHVLAFHDVDPQKKIHVLLIPKGEYVDLDHFNSKYYRYITPRPIF